MQLQRAIHHAEPVLTPVHKLGFAALLVFVFLLHSRVFDMGLYRLHIPSVLLTVALIAAFASGGVMRAFTNRIGMCLLALSAWMCMATVFSVWRGYSAVVIRDQWLRCFLIYFVLAALIFSWKQYLKTCSVLCISVLVLALMTLIIGNVTVDGRLGLGRGRFGNPNDLAQILLMSLPFWWFLATRRGLTAPRRALAYAATLPIFITIARTGSRGALIATGGLLVILFLRSSLKYRVQLLAAGVVVLVFAAATLPEDLKERYFTFFRKADARDTAGLLAPEEAADYATTSATARWNLLWDSLILTFRNPVFGVGPGVFDVAQDIYSRAVRGVKGGWQQTHNTYTQISSENGIPALLVYLLVILFTWRAARVAKPRGRPPSAREAEMMAASRALRLSLFTFCVSAFFASFAYQAQLLTLAGLAVSLKRIAAHSAPPEPARTPAPAAAAAVCRSKFYTR